MRILITVAVQFILIQCTLSQSIAFENGTWESALKKAKQEDKIIFVDAYTTWCGPCKMMAKNVFTDNDVARFYNDQFVNMKIDMEKGEGLLFARAYDVEAYPTFLFIDARGEIAHKGLGYMNPKRFIAFGEEATDEENRLGTLESRYKKGERDPAFLKKYAIALKKAYDDRSSEIAELYLESQEDWTSADNAVFIIDMASDQPDSKTYQFLVENRDQLAAHGDIDKIDQKLKIGVMRQIQYDNMNLEKQEAHFNTIFGGKGAEYFAEYNMKKYSRMRDEKMTKKYLETTTHYINSFNITDWRVLNSAAWNFYENTDDNELLEHACNWALTSVTQDSNSMNNDTVAALYYKLGKKKKAKHFAEESIRLAMENDEDYTETEKLLEKINNL